MRTKDKTREARDAEAPVFALHHVDRRSGLPLRANGSILTILTRTPEATTAEALRNRDAALWQVRVERLSTIDAAGRR